MNITVSNRDLGTLTITSVTRLLSNNCYAIGFTSEAGSLAAILCDDGRLEIRDNDFPGLRYNVERFRPLLVEAIQCHESRA